MADEIIYLKVDMDPELKAEFVRALELFHQQFELTSNGIGHRLIVHFLHGTCTIYAHVLHGGNEGVMRWGRYLGI